MKGFVLVLLSLAVSCWGFSLVVTGDVNLNPSLDQFQLQNASYVWGDMIDVLRGADVLAINHESTLAGLKVSDPAVIQFEDPLHYLATYKAAGVDFISQANNHQCDFSWQGLRNTVAALRSLGIAWGGLGPTPSDVMSPRVVPSPDGSSVAFFTLVVDECWKNANSTLYLDGCTCGANSGPPPAYQCVAAGTAGAPYGLWYTFGITDALIANVTATVQRYKRAHPEQFVVVYLHVGPNFQWQPYAEHEQLLRNVSQVADLVWGTSSHHIQRFEVWKGTPIIYGLGDLLFRHVPGVSDFCPLYAIPCEQYRPELALTYQFEVVRTANGLRVDLGKILAYATRHTDQQTFRCDSFEDLAWIENLFNELSSPGGVTASYQRDLGAFVLNVTSI